MKTDVKLIVSICENLEKEYRKEMDAIHEEKDIHAYTDVRYNYLRGLADAYASIIDNFKEEEE